jgi:hypothetical protein
MFALSGPHGFKERICKAATPSIRLCEPTLTGFLPDPKSRAESTPRVHRVQVGVFSPRHPFHYIQNQVFNRIGHRGSRGLTSALSGPGEAMPARRRRDNFLRACGALAPALHEPLQRMVRSQKRRFSSAIAAKPSTRLRLRRRPRRKPATKGAHRDWRSTVHAQNRTRRARPEPSRRATAIA